MASYEGDARAKSLKKMWS